MDLGARQPPSIVETRPIARLRCATTSIPSATRRTLGSHLAGFPAKIGAELTAKLPSTAGWRAGNGHMIRLRLLGPVELHDAHGADSSTVLAQPKRLSLLAYLAAASPRGFHRRDTLLALLWPELDETHARKALNQALGFLRQALESDDGEVLVSRGTQSIGVDASRCWCDVVAFEEAATAGRYAEALELYRGDFLTGWFVDQAPGFEDWSDRERSRLRGVAAEAARQLARERQQANDRQNAIQAARRALELSRSDEGALRLVIELLDATGDRAGALAAYAEFEKQLVSDLGVEPSPETRALVAQIRSRTAASPRASLPSTESEVDASTAAVAAAPISVAAPRRIRRPRRWFWAAAGAIAVAALFTFRNRNPEIRASLPPTPPSAPAVAPATPSPVASSAPAIPDSNTVRATTDASALARLDRDVVAVLPFRVLDSDTSLTYLREGMVDLVSAKLGSVLRAVDPRLMIGAWQRAGAERVDADTQLVASLARQLRAGLVLRGSITGVGPAIVLRASLTEMRDGSTRRVSVEVLRDSLPRGVDSLITELLAVHARDDVRHLATLPKVSLPILREYLAAQALSRQGRFEEAIPHYIAAIGPDSDFALAGMGLANAGLSTFGRYTPTGWRVATKGRDKLSERDRAILDATVGPTYPAMPSKQEFFEFAERARRLAPDRIDSWTALGFNLFEGAVRDAPNWPHDAIAAYNRALELDSTSLDANDFLGELYLRIGDTARARVAMERLVRLDSTSISGAYNLWRAATAFGQKERRARALEALNRSHAYSTVSNIKFFAFATGLGFEDQEAPLLRILEDGRGRDAALWPLNELAALRGQPKRAAQFADSVSINNNRVFQRTLIAAMFEDGDSATAARFRDWAEPSRMDAFNRNCGIVSIVASAYDLEVRHDTTLASEVSGVIEGLDPSKLSGVVARRCWIGRPTLRVLLSRRKAEAELRRHAEALDSVLKTGPMSCDGDLLPNMGNLILAHAWEQLREPRRALAAVRRRSNICDPAQGFARMLRDEARLAAATGDIDGAIRAYRIFIALRRDAEPSLQPQVSLARSEMNRLVAMRARRRR